VVLVASPTALISRKSRVYVRLVSAGGDGGRNCDPERIR
jgi:hypothetical protein